MLFNHGIFWVTFPYELHADVPVEGRDWSGKVIFLRLVSRPHKKEESSGKEPRAGVQAGRKVIWSTPIVCRAPHRQMAASAPLLLAYHGLLWPRITPLAEAASRSFPQITCFLGTGSL